MSRRASPSAVSRSARARALHFLLLVCSRLPLSVARGLGRATAGLVWPLQPASRRITERNISLAFPELPARRRQQLARASFTATAQASCEMGHVWLRDLRHVETLIRDVSGADTVSGALASHRGVVVLAPHLGNWEVLGLHLATLGPLVSLYEAPQIDGLAGLLHRSRERSGARLMPTTRRGIAALVRSVREGHIAGILPDQVPRALNAGLNVPFMNVTCFTGTLACKVIQRSGALAVFGFAQRVPGGFYIRYLPAEDAIYSSDMAHSLAAMNRGVETCLRYCPEQYQWEYKRFRERPASQPGPYNAL